LTTPPTVGSSKLVQKLKSGVLPSVDNDDEYGYGDGADLTPISKKKQFLQSQRSRNFNDTAALKDYVKENIVLVSGVQEGNANNLNDMSGFSGNANTGGNGMPMSQFNMQSTSQNFCGGTPKIAAAAVVNEGGSYTPKSQCAWSARGRPGTTTPRSGTPRRVMSEEII
jgi:hypothetical protein